MQKKGALNLSIQAIVIIVLAMTLLGLGLGFVRGLFGNITDLGDSTFEQVSEQLSTDLATSDAPLIFSKSRLVLERRGSALEGFGVQNDRDNSIEYGIVFETFSCPDETRVTPGDPNSDCTSQDGWFTYLKGDQNYEIKAAERQANKVQINIPASAKTGLYLFKISAYTGQFDSVCDENDPASTCEKIGQTELFVTIT